MEYYFEILYDFITETHSRHVDRLMIPDAHGLNNKMPISLLFTDRKVSLKYVVQ